MVDFAELMLRSYELLRDNAAIREHYQRRFRHLLVDEFQDTNKLQYAWLKMFAPPNGDTGQVSPGGIMAVTFTNKAAKEMLTRLSTMLPFNVRGMWIGTFHGLCNRFLRAHWKQANLPQAFQILDSSDTVSAIKRVIKAMKLDEERFVPKQVSWFIAGCKEEAQRPGDVEARDEQTKTLVEIYAN